MVKYYQSTTVATVARKTDIVTQNKLPNNTHGKWNWKGLHDLNIHLK